MELCNFSTYQPGVAVVVLNYGYRWVKNTIFRHFHTLSLSPLSDKMELQLKGDFHGN